MGFAGSSQSGQWVSSACPWHRWSSWALEAWLELSLHAFQCIQRMRQDQMLHVGYKGRACGAGVQGQPGCLSLERCTSLTGCWVRLCSGSGVGPKVGITPLRQCLWLSCPGRIKIVLLWLLYLSTHITERLKFLFQMFVLYLINSTPCYDWLSKRAI